MSTLKTTDVNAHKKLLRDIQSGDVEILKDFRNNHPDIHWTTLRYEKTGDTILHVLSRLGHMNLVSYILENYRPVSVNCRNMDNKTPLHEAAQFGQYDVVKLLIQHDAEVNALKKADWTPLMLACTKITCENDENNYKTVEVLCKSGAAVNYQNKDGWSALHLIAREGDVKILDLLRTYNLNVEALTKNGRTALHVAALHGKYDMASKLIYLGLDVNKADSCGNTPLHDSILSSSLNIANLLLDNEADLYAKNKSEFTILHLPACQGDIGTIEYIISTLNFDIHVTTYNGLTPLHCAAKNKQLSAFDYLMKKGADCCLKDQFLRTPKDYLCI